MSHPLLRGRVNENSPRLSTRITPLRRSDYFRSRELPVNLLVNQRSPRPDRRHAMRRERSLGSFQRGALTAIFISRNVADINCRVADLIAAARQSRTSFPDAYANSPDAACDQRIFRIRAGFRNTPILYTDKSANRQFTRCDTMIPACFYSCLFPNRLFRSPLFQIRVLV